MNPSQTTFAGVRHRTAAVNDTRLHYVTAGERGTPVLLVHGFPETWWAFRKLIPLLAARHRVYAVDLRGFGDSSLADENYSSAVAAEDLHALIEHLSMGSMHVVGQDVSGGVVYRLAATHPEDVISLTAIESGLAGFGAEGLADVTHGGVWYIGALAALGIAGLLFEKEARAFVGGVPVPPIRRHTYCNHPGGRLRVCPHLRQDRRILRRRRPVPRHAHRRSRAARPRARQALTDARDHDWGPRWRVHLHGIPRRNR